jgi:hypothetical protein
MTEKELKLFNKLNLTMVIIITTRCNTTMYLLNKHIINISNKKQRNTIFTRFVDKMIFFLIYLVIRTNRINRAE